MEISESQLTIRPLLTAGTLQLSVSLKASSVSLGSCREFLLSALLFPSRHRCLCSGDVKPGGVAGIFGLRSAEEFSSRQDELPLTGRRPHVKLFSSSFFTVGPHKDPLSTDDHP